MPKSWITTPDYQGECRRKANGVNRLVWTVMVAACGVITTGAFLWITSVSSRVTVAEATLSTRGERLSTVENAVQNIDTRLTRIENKLDEALAKPTGPGLKKR